jgi:1-acyl-sn-glycerol-3-phosphate acyltransferase
MTRRSGEETPMDAWNYEPAMDLGEPLLERLRRFPREPDMLVYSLRTAAALAVRAYLRAYHRFQIDGIEHLPPRGAFVIVSNHASHLDALCLMSALPLHRLHRAFAAAASDYFFTSRHRLAAAVLLVNALPFHRQLHVRQSLSLCRQLLADGENVLVLFPEGSRTRTGEIGPFKPGIGALLAGTNVPVVPCHLSGTMAALGKGMLFPRPCKVRLTIGRPVHFGERTTPTDIAQQLQSAVGGLCHD